MSITNGLSFILLLVACVLSSCGKEDDSNLKINIDEEFDVRLYEELQPGNNKLVIHAITKEPLDCSNYDLGHSNSSTDGTVIMSLDEIELEGECDSVQAYAETAARLNPIITGSHDIEINLALSSIENEGVLIVTDDQYVLEMETTHGISLENTQLNKIPDYYCWGYFELIDYNATTLQDDFFSVLSDHSPFNNIRPGFYGHFHYQDGKITLIEEMVNEQIPPASIKFIYALDENSRSEVLTFVKGFEETYGDKVRIVFMTGAGEIL